VGRQELAADRVQLLTDDLNRALVRAPACGQPRPEPRSELADQARTHANENLCATIIGRVVEYAAGRSYTGATTTLYVHPGSKHIGEVQGWNVDTGKRVWTHTFAKSANWGPILTTGGGLVFAGGTNDRMFRAFDAKNGKLLWEHPTNSGIIGVPISFAVDGKQYVAVQSGFGIDSRAMQARLNRLVLGEYPEVPEGGAVWVFAVK